ncbi:MAG: hypothetical protein CMF94_05370 [Candidatus Marinimicrobia bacterium]|nr:hypothetical protein [Candidatus Neomarinimicrobiota bacterium]
MINFIYCFDENYNSQALTSINSLLMKTSEKVNIYIIHENPESFDIGIINDENINSLNIFKITIDDIEFPNLSGTHVSKATYYRFYLSKFLPHDLDYIIYIDADILCLNDPFKGLQEEIEKLKNSSKKLAARTEVTRFDDNLTVNPFLNLNLKNDKYFNAGLMIIDFEYWIKNEIEEQLFNLMNELYEDIVFWDQDVLNKLFDGEYLELNDFYNYEFGVFNEDKYDEEFVLSNVKFLHYTGKGKPWDTNFIFFKSSNIFQKYYQLLNLENYLLSHSTSIKGSFKNYLKKIYSLQFLKLEYPFSYLKISIRELSKLKIRFLYNKNKIFDESIVERDKPKNLSVNDEYLFSHEYQKVIPQSYIRILRNPIVINNSIFDLKKLRLYTKETFYENHTYSKKIKDTIKNLLRSKKGTENIKNGVWILDTKSENFGHWMIDALCRYQLVPRDFSTYEILLPERFNIGWVIEMLDHLGYPYRILETNKKYIVENLILTSRAHPSGNYNLKIVNKLRDLFLSEINSELHSRNKRIWTYREHISRKVDNFEEIEKILKKNNFDIIYTDKLSLKEKISLLSSTQIISGTHGSGLINLFFMRKGAKIFEIRDLKDDLKNAVYSLASALGIDYYYMERKNDINQGGSIDPKIFEQKLLECINSQDNK